MRVRHRDVYAQQEDDGDARHEGGASATTRWIHLLSPLMEYDEDNPSSFVGSYAKFEPCEYVGCDVEVTSQDGVSIVNSRIGSVNNTAGWYAIVGPMGLSNRAV